jgi:hypothetical protein
VGLHSLAPQPTELIFDEWWEKANMATSGIASCYGSGSPGRKHVPTTDKDYFLLLAC